MVRLRRTRIAKWAALVAALVQTLLLVQGAPGALAQAEYYVGTHFTPQISVKSSTTQAGAHPDLELTLKKTPSHCPGQSFEPWGYGLCSADEIYLEQDFKDQTIHLPPGLLGDVNAAPQCDLRGWSGFSLFGWWREPPRGGAWSACPPESQVGVVSFGHPYLCQWSRPWREHYLCSDWFGEPLAQTMPVGGFLYNGVPEPGEQAHLYMVSGICGNPEYPARCDPRKGLSQAGPNMLVSLVHIGIELRADSDWGIDAIVKDLPQAACLGAAPELPDTWCPPLGPKNPRPFAVDDATITLFGQTSAERGHPYTLNPTSCQGRDVAGSFRGYAQNVWFDGSWAWWEGWGDGLDAASSAPYPVTGCNSLPYEPKLSVALEDAAPEAPSAITSTVTQELGEQTTKEIKVEIPKSFKVNFANRLVQCAADQAAARACPQQAKVGEVTVESSLLPESGDFAGPLRGEVFIGETTATNIRLYILLHGFVEATLQGSVAMNADGSSRAAFELPEVPQQRIELTLLGGPDKALVTTPRSCGIHTWMATFTSHQGTAVRREIPIEIVCTGARFDARLGTRRPKAHPTLTLTAKSPSMRSVSFDLSRYLKVGAHPARLVTLGRYGTVTLQSEDGPRELKLRLLRRGRLGSLAFAATAGSSNITTLSAYDAKLEGKAKRRLKAGRTKGPTRIAFSGLPQGTTQVGLELEGQRDGLIQNPSTCKVTGKRLRLGFGARIGGTGRAREVLNRSVAMRCTKSTRSTRR